METIFIEIKKYDDVAIFTVPETSDGLGVMLRLIIHDPSRIIAVSKFQFAMKADNFLEILQSDIDEYLNPEVVKISDKMTLVTSCRHCMKNYEMNLDTKDYESYLNGALAQKAFPYLTASERELIISQTCEDCWNALFKDCE